MTQSLPTSFVLVDTGVLSRYFLKKPEIVKAYNELSKEATPVISASIYIELMRWLVGIRGRTIDQISRSEFDALRKQLDKYIHLNHSDCIELAVQASRLYPDTGLGNCFSIGVGLFFDIPVFTLNRTHFERIPGIRLYIPDNYEQLESR